MIPDGWHWNQAELGRGDPLNRVLLSILVIDDELNPVPIGSAFIVAANGAHATAVTAAHNFEGIRTALNPNMNHHPTTPSEFLPPPKEVDLKRVKALYLKDDKAHFCSLEIGVWDCAIDLAAFSVSAPESGPDLFQEFLWIDNQMPAVRDEVAMVGFGRMAVMPDPDNPGKGTIQRQLLMRVGRVEETFPKRHVMLKGPCIQTSIAIFSGMSGGFVAKWSGPGTTIKPFAFISHAPEPQPSEDRSQSGHSMAAKLNATIKSVGNKKQMLEFAVSDIGVGKNGERSTLVPSFEFVPTVGGLEARSGE